MALLLKSLEALALDNVKQAIAFQPPTHLDKAE